MTRQEISGRIRDGSIPMKARYLNVPELVFPHDVLIKSDLWPEWELAPVFCVNKFNRSGELVEHLDPLKGKSYIWQELDGVFHFEDNGEAIYGGWSREEVKQIIGGQENGDEKGQEDSGTISQRAVCVPDSGGKEDNRNTQVGNEV